MKKQYFNPTTPQEVVSLSKDEVFVFGSNLAGRHGKGAALTALKFGAKRGAGMGPAGQTYAIATKDAELKQLPLSFVAAQVETFRQYASFHPRVKFLVTAIGCGLAQRSPIDIAPMFKDMPANVSLPLAFQMLLDDTPF